METPWKVIGAFLGVFVAGAIFGGFLTIGVAAKAAAQRNVTASEAPSAPAVPAREPHNSAAPTRRPLLEMPLRWQAPQLMRRYAERLELTPEQKERITPLIQRATEDYRRVQQSTFRETGIILQRLQEDIAKELTPDQSKKLEAMEEHQRDLLERLERFREMRKGNAARQRAGAEPNPEAPQSSASTTTTSSTSTDNSSSNPAKSSTPAP